jgi:hypothetical protein
MVRPLQKGPAQLASLRNPKQGVTAILDVCSSNWPVCKTASFFRLGLRVHGVEEQLPERFDPSHGVQAKVLVKFQFSQGDAAGAYYDPVPADLEALG